MPGLPLPDDFSDPARFGPASSGSQNGSQNGGASAIRCPACRREHLYEPPCLPCPCGAQLRVPLLRGGVPVQVRFRSWEDSWLSMRCPHCGRNDQWPQPEFTCNCGATVRLPVDRAPRLQSTGLLGPAPQYEIPPHAGGPTLHPYGSRPSTGVVPTVPPQGQPGSHQGNPTGGRPGSSPGAYPGTRPSTHPSTHPAGRPQGQPQSRPRAPFRPHPVRSPEDAVLTAARYLQWLGFDDLELTDDQSESPVTLLGSRMVALVDAGSEPADNKAVECLWLQTLHAEEIAAAMFVLGGFSHQATVRGEQLLVALFRLDLAGVPQPANGAAEALMETGWTS
ncbi:hypothetical protein [Kitasatospora sp. MAP5-34]|uniref:hypothetical protein n=1 Tax=Kitasatospora sp. MAP5-34 TaxID=3035102 RepID=UPI002474E871|nr:hypothetical protein [Kitasatospora sp. MAP5-34]MDH6579238.1 hypothetical protein [Kitasatospora sp. MAP5-34]